jgi:hypothetical protein
VVHTVKIVGPFDERGFFRCEGGETVPELLYHGLRIAAEVDRVREPRDAEFEFAFSGFDV